MTTSPFPGVDPYLESPAYWRDFHQRFVTYWSDWLADHVPDHYSVRIDERVTRIDEDERADMLPDVAINQNYPLPTQHPGGAVALEREPVVLRVTMLDTETENYIRVHHRDDQTLITVLELLSPTNKSGKGREYYLRKRHEFLRDPVHVVELDLLRDGQRLPMMAPYPPGDYFALVSRGENRPASEVYHWTLRETMPRIRIPLKPPDPDLVFDLPGLFTLAYQRGRYGRELPYDKPPAVTLSPADADWARERVAAWKP